MNKKILTAGEPMGLFIAQEEALLEDVRHFSTSVAGAEFNVAVGLSRLGHTAGYLTKLGADPFGRQIVKVMNQNGIDTSLTVTTGERSTGFMLKSKTSRGDPDIYYYRKNSAASTLCVEDVKGADLTKWDALHMTGILPAISETAREASFYLMRKAKKAGIPVFFDPNLRPQLWPSRDEMVGTVNELASLADYVLPGKNEGEILCGSTDPTAIGAFYLGLGVGTVIVKTGGDGAWTARADGAFRIPAYEPREIVDTVGAGDGFAAGVISGVLEGLPLREAVRRGNAIGAIQIMSVSDNEGLPTRAELGRFMAETRQKPAERTK